MRRDEQLPSGREGIITELRDAREPRPRMAPRIDVPFDME